MKKVVLLLLILATLVSVTACGKKKFASTQTEAGSLPVSSISSLPDQPEPQPLPTDLPFDQTVSDLNGLLVGLSVRPNTAPAVENWSEEQLLNALYGKLLHDDGEDSYLKKAGITYTHGPEYYQSYDFAQINALSVAAFGRQPTWSTKTDFLFVSGNQVRLTPATGEKTVQKVQDFYMQNGQVIAIGTTACYNGLGCVFEGYFKAVCTVNPDSIYGLTLVSFESINQPVATQDYTLVASSSLPASGGAVYTPNCAMDGNIGTAWVEGAAHDGEGEWIRIQSATNTPLQLAAITLNLGYCKTPELLEANGIPTTLLVEGDNGFREEFQLYGPLDDSETIQFSRPLHSSWVTVTIVETRPGTQHHDTAISEITFHGIDVNLLKS